MYKELISKAPFSHFKNLLTYILQNDETLRKKDRAKLFSAAMKIYRSAVRHSGDKERLAEEIGQAKNIDSLIQMFNRIERSQEAEEKQEGLNDLLSHRAIFFMLSSHAKCAKDHLEYQGKIFVDMHWRQKMDKADPGYYAVQSYIRNHAVPTVQSHTRRAPYLVTRPNCHHFFIPLDTWVVLTSSRRAVEETYKDRVRVNNIGKKSKSQKELDMAYYQFRYEIHADMVGIQPTAVTAGYIRNDIKYYKRAKSKLS